jgi:hypothetical protein
MLITWRLLAEVPGDSQVETIEVPEVVALVDYSQERKTLQPQPIQLLLVEAVLLLQLQQVMELIPQPSAFLSLEAVVVAQRETHFHQVQ